MIENNLLETIVDTTHALIVVLDAEGRIVLFNKACERVSGYAFEEVRGRKCWDFLLLPGEAACVMETFENLRAGRTPSQHLNHWVSRSGEARLIEWSNSTISDESGRVIQVIGTGIDVTERERTGKENAELLQRQSALLNTIRESAFLRDANGVFLEVNHGFLKRHGLERKDVVGKTPFDLFSRKHAQRLLDNDAEVIKSRQPSLIEVMNERGGEERWHLISRSPVLDSAGQVIGIAGISRDITEARHARQAATDAKKQQSALLDSFPDAAWLKDASGRYIAVNRKFADLLDDPAIDPIGKSTSDIFPKEISAIYAEEDRRIIESGQPLVQERRRTIRGKPQIRMVFRYPVLDDSGRVIGVAGVSRDITESRGAEEQLLLALQRQKALLDGIPDAAWLLDAGGRYIEVNKGYRERLGNDSIDPVGKTAFEIHSADFAATIQEEERRIMATRQPLRVERKRLVKGRELDLDVIKVPVMDAAGNVTGIACLSLDITKHKQAEQSLREAQLRQKALLDNIPDAAWLKDTEGRFIEVNQHFLDRYSDVRSTIIGKTSGDFRPPHQAERSKAEDHEVLRSGLPLRIERCLDLGESQRWFDVIKAPITDDQGRIAGLVGVSRDITERKLAEQTLRAALQSQKALLDTIPDAAWLKDSAGRYVEVNRNWLARHNRERADVIGKTHLEIFDEKSAREVIAEDLQVVDTKRSLHIERHGLEHENKRWLEITKTPVLDENGNVIGIAGVSRDITERRLAEQARLRRDAELRAALIREVNHRIKNNLQSVMALLHLHTVSHPETAAVVHKAISRLNAIATVHGMHSTTGGQDINLCNIVNALAGSMWGLRSGAPIEVQTGDDFRAVRVMNSETVPIALIVNELMQNAVKHSPAAGPDNPIRIRLERDGPAIRIRISNSGTVLPATFDFARGNGLGTGLQLVKSLMPQNGAEIRFESTDGGVTVTLVFAPPILLPNADPQNAKQVIIHG